MWFHFFLPNPFEHENYGNIRQCGHTCALSLFKDTLFSIGPIVRPDLRKFNAMI